MKISSDAARQVAGQALLFDNNLNTRLQGVRPVGNLRYNFDHIGAGNANVGVIDKSADTKIVCVSVGRRIPLKAHRADNNLGPMGSEEFLSRKIDAVAGQARLAVSICGEFFGGLFECVSEKGHNGSGERTDDGSKNRGVFGNPPPSATRQIHSDNPFVGLGVVFSMFIVGGWIIWKVGR